MVQELDSDGNSYDGNSYDCIVDPMIIVRDIFFDDDKHKFLTFLEEYGFPEIVPPCITSMIFEHGAEECAKALLEDETGYTIDIHDTLSDDFENWTPLHQASFNGHLPIVSLLLRHGAQPNIRTNCLVRTHPSDNMLPLNYAVARIRSRLFEYSPDCNPEEHIFRAIFVLCLPKMKEMREVLSLLLEKTEEDLVEKEIFHYFIEGKVIELATLLIVAPEKVMSPSVYKKLCHTDTGLERSMAYINFIIKRIAELENLKLSSMSNGNCKMARKCQHQLALMMRCTWIKPFKPCYESAVKMKSPTILHGKPESPKLVAYTSTSFGHESQNLLQSSSQSTSSMAINDQNCNYERLQSLTVELEKLCKHEYLNDWSPRKSIFKLIYILCLPELQGGLLKSIRSNFALQSKNIEELSCICLKEGKLVELAVLLMVAHECLLDCIILILCVNLHGKIAITQVSKTYWNRDLNEQVTLIIVVKGVPFLRLGLLKLAQKSAWLEVPHLRPLESLRPLCIVPKRLEKFGNLSKRFPLKDVGTPSCYPVHLFPLVEVSPMLSGQRTFHVFGSAARSFHTCQMLDSSFGFMSSKPKGTETMKTVKPLTADLLSGEQLTMFARAFRRGIKRS
ncbi:hypothetical protein COLO4_19875 [Corchorus olitorius]|uniref:Uncharacterized protein n=1 Tax=Corchorus olitorius TaxID=93759 RepID=A0A1R3J2W3_9ROSI|nr:hypothetical protein COLO4_19875 [Corchorus olitorius]